MDHAIPPLPLSFVRLFLSEFTHWILRGMGWRKNTPCGRGKCYMKRQKCDWRHTGVLLWLRLRLRPQHHTEVTAPIRHDIHCGPRLRLAPLLAALSVLRGLLKRHVGGACRCRGNIIVIAVMMVVRLTILFLRGALMWIAVGWLGVGPTGVMMWLGL